MSWLYKTLCVIEGLSLGAWWGGGLFRGGSSNFRNLQFGKVIGAFVPKEGFCSFFVKYVYTIANKRTKGGGGGYISNQGLV